MSRPVMKCGHVANATCEGKPCCIICMPNKDAFIVMEEESNYDGRSARCTECGKIVNSNENLAFFKHTSSEFDEYYCGCKGWN